MNGNPRTPTRTTRIYLDRARLVENYIKTALESYGCRCFKIPNVAAGAPVPDLVCACPCKCLIIEVKTAEEDSRIYVGRKKMDMLKKMDYGACEAYILACYGDLNHCEAFVPKHIDKPGKRVYVPRVYCSQPLDKVLRSLAYCPPEPVRV